MNGHYISVVIPVHNESKNVFLLYKKLVRVLDSLKKDYEIIYVDDGSKDNTFKEITSICNSDKRVRGIQFQKNFKKSAAYMAGFKHSKGEVIITMDGDLQDDPEEIPRFLKTLETCDMVVGWKFPRRDSFYKTIPSKIFNFLNYKLFGLKLHDYDCGFRAMKKELANELNLYGDIYRHIPSLLHNLGFHIKEIKVRHHPRIHGKSKYGFSRLITGSLDLLTVKFLLDFQQRPLHLFGTLGILSFFLGFLAELYVLYTKFFLNELFITHMPMLIFGVLLILLGVQLLSIGLIAELVTSSRKVFKYNIKKVLN